jgi:hypothetical protein
MLGRLAAQDEKRRPSDEALAARAAGLSRAYLGGRAVPASVTWSSRQGKRWGSCTTVDRTIRISDRVRGMPRWVLDYVLLHELAHLLHPGHGPDFWAELAGYPHLERARGFLDGYAHAVGRGEAGGGMAPDDDETPGEVDDEFAGSEDDDEPAGGVPGGGAEVDDEVAAPGRMPAPAGLLF